MERRVDECYDWRSLDPTYYAPFEAKIFLRDWYSDGLTPTKVPDILPVNVLKKTDFGPLPNKMTWCLIAHLGCIHPSRTTGSPNLVTTSTLYAESVKFYLKLGSDHLALVSEFEFLEVVGDKKEATEDRTIS
ncbi:hypothetical protein P3S68_005894 [Capsicum galapagoense]